AIVCPFLRGLGRLGVQWPGVRPCRNRTSPLPSRNNSCDSLILANTGGNCEQVCGSATGFSHRAVDLTLRVTLRRGLTLVVELLAPRHADIDLCPAVLQAHAQRDKRHPLLLRRPNQVVDLTTMREELARPIRIMVRPATVRIRRNMAADQPQFAVIDAHISLGDGDLAIPNRLDLCSCQHDAGLELFLDEVIVKRAPVLCHHPFAAGRFGSGFCALLLRHSGNLTRFAPLTRQESHPYPDCDRLHNQLHTGYTYGGSGRGSRAGRDTRDTLSPARQRRVAPSHAATGKAISW